MADSPIRNDFRRMMKHGRLRALRNLPVGWVMQAIHSTDRSERRFRIVLEAILIILAYRLLSRVGPPAQPGVDILFSAILIVHSLSWLLFGNFWVYMLDSFGFVRNPGINGVLEFTAMVRRVYSRTDCCDAILIYGSMSRRQFHQRSDLDLRILRSQDLRRGLVAISIGLAIKAYSFFKRIPVDLQIVDSMSFLRHQMRDDEKPIVVYRRAQTALGETGLPIDDVLRDPAIVLRK